jgi:3-oxoacyl-(acyl-carrier-protein) synthase
MPQSPERIVVTAAGIITSLGTGREQHLKKLRACEPALRHPRFLDTRHAHEFVVGEVDASNEMLARRLGFDPESAHLTRTALLSMCAFQDLEQQADMNFL